MNLWCGDRVWVAVVAVALRAVAEWVPERVVAVPNGLSYPIRLSL
jgi:hypothetical protein